MAATQVRKESSLRLLAALFLPLACSGQVGDSVDSPDDDQGGGGKQNPPMMTGGRAGEETGAGGSGPPAPAACKVVNVGPSLVRRLTHVEYDNAVADLLGDRTQPSTDFPDDSQSGLFKNSAMVQSVPPLLAEGYLKSATQLAQRADVKALAGCDLATPSCVSGFIQRFGRRAFRHPLAAAEAQRLQQVYDAARTAADPETGVRAVVAATLVAPQFLYYFEAGGEDAGTTGVKKLAPFEVAARLGSLLWASLPDEALLDAAANGQLSTRAQVAAQAARMLKDSRARAATNVFYEQWFGLHELDTVNKDAQQFPDFGDLRGSLREETTRFVNHVIWEGDGRLATLLSAPFSFLDARLAALYGAQAPAGKGFSMVTLDPKQRAGILTQGSFLAGFSGMVETSPFRRGAWVRTRMLCQELPAPPNEIPPLPPIKDGVSLRERAQQHTQPGGCRGCHMLIDGLGFGLEQYDVIGRVRTMDRGMALDTSGEITSTEDIDGKFNGGAELARSLAKSSQVRDCAPTQWLRYALARPAAREDACSLDSLKGSFAASGGNLRDLLLALVQTDAFLHYRRPE